MTPTTEKYHKNSTTKSVSKTLAILSTFTEDSPVQRTSDIADKLKMNVSTVSRHLNTLLDWGFLEREDDTGFYYPGINIITLAGISLQRNDVYRFAAPELQQISHEFDIHSHMAIPHKTDIIHMINFASEYTKEIMMPMGHRHPMHCSAMGRAIMAYLPQEKVADILKNSELREYASETKTDIQEIYQELKKTRQKGYCLLINELTEGKGSIAAPIFNRYREPVAAISVSTSARSISRPERELELSKIVTFTALRISGKLGYFSR